MDATTIAIIGLLAVLGLVIVFAMLRVATQSKLALTRLRAQEDARIASEPGHVIGGILSGIFGG